MGGGTSKGGSNYVEKPDTERKTTSWKLLPSTEEAYKKFVADGTLKKGHSEPGHLELRAVLDEPVAQHTLGKYARKIRSLDIFMCWVDIQEYKEIPTEDYRRSKALHIYHKYIKAGAVLEIGGISPEQKQTFHEDLERSKVEKELLTPDFYDRCQFQCFLEIYNNIFIPFKSTEEYAAMSQSLKSTYNNVRTDDFVYFQKLGEGGFGLVVHCMKKSTRTHYAMKIQTKAGLLDCFSDDPLRVDYEKRAFASCQHPFIVNLEYAFQTPTLAIMVLGLATSGDLALALKMAPEERLPESRVQFYVAELTLALAYLHQMGLMYRDLKPNNVLLTADGHIQLVDLGGVVDESGTALGGPKNNTDSSLVPLFSTQHIAFNTDLANKEAAEAADAAATGAVGSAGNGDNAPKRRLSIMGTFGYMAPEMVIMMHQTSREKVGYSNAVDWWSLGVTMFKLLTGYRPFSEDNFQSFIDIATSWMPQGMSKPQKPHNSDVSPEYAMLFATVPYPQYLSNDAKDFISKLLDVNDKTRLGSGPQGVAQIKAHPFFTGIDWNLLEQKHVVPPHIPPPSLVDETPHYASIEAMLRDLGKEDWVTEMPPKEDQKYFQSWDFTSKHTLRVEFGLANEMEQYDRNFKVRQIMGGKDPHSASTPKARKNSVV